MGRVFPLKRESVSRLDVIIFLSWLLLLIGTGLFTWFFVIRGRGSLRYWIRVFEVGEQCVLGRTFGVEDRAEHSQFLTDALAHILWSHA